MTSRLLRALASVGLVAMAVLVAAPAANADQIWYQAIGRASVDTACPTTDAADAAAGWSGWDPSWAAWPGGGAGGFVCSRSVTWAYEAGVEDRCVRFAGTAEDGRWFDFGSGWSVPSGVPYWTNKECSGPSAGPYYDANILGWVYAPEELLQALNRCKKAFDALWVNTDPVNPVFACYNAD